MSPIAAVDQFNDHLVVESASVRAVFDRAGTRLVALVMSGHELLRTRDARGDVWFGGFVMAPWAGIIPGAAFSRDGISVAIRPTWGEDALHGVMRFARFEERDGALSGALPREWPWKGTLTLEPRATHAALHIAMTLRADDAMPAVIGLHPWFARTIGDSEPLEFALPATARMRERDADGVPTGRWVQPGNGPRDDAFLGATPLVLRWPGVGELTVSSSGTPDAMIAAGQSVSLEITMRWATQ